MGIVVDQERRSVAVRRRESDGGRGVSEGGRGVSEGGRGHFRRPHAED